MTGIFTVKGKPEFPWHTVVGHAAGVGPRSEGARDTRTTTTTTTTTRAANPTSKEPFARSSWRIGVTLSPPEDPRGPSRGARGRRSSRARAARSRDRGRLAAPVSSPSPGGREGHSWNRRAFVRDPRRSRSGSARARRRSPARRSRMFPSRPRFEGVGSKETAANSFAYARRSTLDIGAVVAANPWRLRISRGRVSDGTHRAPELAPRSISLRRKRATGLEGGYTVLKIANRAARWDLKIKRGMRLRLHSLLTQVSVVVWKSP